MSQAHYPSVSTVPQVVEPKTTDVCSDATADGRPSHQVPVEQFEVKLIWPVFVQPVRKNDVEWLCPELDPKQPDFLNAWVKQILEKSNGGWQEVTSSYPPLQGEEAGPAYAEFCYFHPFVRNFLFVNRGDVRAWWKQPDNQKKGHVEDVAESRNRNLRVLKRMDLDKSKLDFEYDMKPDCAAQQTLTSSFDVKSCWMYLFDTQIALMELHIAYTGSTSVNLRGIEQTPPNLNLRMVLKLQDIMRRVYSPYWSVYGTDTETVHDDVHVPRKMILKKPGGEIVASFGNFRVPKTVISEADAKDVCSLADHLPGTLTSDQEDAVQSAIDQRTQVFEHREPFTTAVWRELLSPLTPVRLTQPDTPQPDTPPPHHECPLRYEHIQDDRCPLMSYIAVVEPAAESTFGDTGGIRQISKGDWIRLAGIDDEGDSSRWPFSPSFYDGDPLKGYAYDRFWHSTGYKPAQDIHTTRWLCSAYSFSAVGRANDKFFTDPHAGALCHFRHHYCALVMVALFHRASLLRYKHALSEHADALYGSSATNRHEGKRLFHEKTVRLQEELMRFRSLYWISEVSNQTQGQELFSMLRNHLNLDKLYDDICVDIDKASAVLRQDADDKRQEASWTLTLLGVAFFIVNVFQGPLNDRLKGTPDGGFVGALTLSLLVSGIIGAIARSSVCELIARIIRGFRATSDNDEDSASSWLIKYSDNPAFRVLPLISFLLGAFGLIYCLNSPEKVESGVSSPESHVTPQEPATLRAQDKVGTAATSTIPVTTSDDQGPVDQPIPPAEPSSGLDTPAKPPRAKEDTAPTTEPDPASAQPDVREPTPPVDSAPSQDSTDASGSKANPDASAPQNPKSGSEPPNQDKGDGGDNPASR